MLKYTCFGIISVIFLGNITENIYLCSVILVSTSDIKANRLWYKSENATGGGDLKNDEIINWVLSRIG